MGGSCGLFVILNSGCVYELCVCVGNEAPGQAEPTVDGIVETVAAPPVALPQCKTPGLQMPAQVPLCLRAFSGAKSPCGPTLSRLAVPLKSCSPLQRSPIND